FIRPAYRADDRFRVRIQQELRAVETHAPLWLVRAGYAKTVQLSRPRVGQKDMPNMVRTFLDRDPDVFFRVLHAVDQAKLNSAGVRGKNRKVHAVPRPGCAQWIGLTEKRSYRSHKRAAHLSGIGPMLAMRNGA